MVSDAREPMKRSVGGESPASGRRSERSTMSPRREFAAVLAACGVGAALLLVAAGQPWVHVLVALPRPLPDAGYALTGRELAPAAGAVGLVGLAGVAGTVATRGYPRSLVGLLLALAGVAASYASLRGAGQPAVHRALATEAALLRDGAVTAAHTGWAGVSVAGGALLAVAGAVTAARGRKWPSLSRKYDAPGSRAGADATGGSEPQEAHDMWDSLDRGKDPTAPEQAPEERDRTWSGSSGSDR